MPELIAKGRPEDELLKETASLLHKTLILLDAAGASYAAIHVDHALTLVEQQIRLGTN